MTAMQPPAGDAHDDVSVVTPSRSRGAHLLDLRAIVRAAQGSDAYIGDPPMKRADYLEVDGSDTTRARSDDADLGVHLLKPPQPQVRARSIARFDVPSRIDGRSAS